MKNVVMLEYVIQQRDQDGFWFILARECNLGWAERVANGYRGLFPQAEIKVTQLIEGVDRDASSRYGQGW